MPKRYDAQKQPLKIVAVTFPKLSALLKKLTRAASQELVHLSEGQSLSHFFFLILHRASPFVERCSPYESDWFYMNILSFTTKKNTIKIKERIKRTSENDIFIRRLVIVWQLHCILIKTYTNTTMVVLTAEHLSHGKQWSIILQRGGFV